MFTQKFLKDLLERAVSTAAQTAIVAIPTSLELVQSVHWDVVAGAAGLGFILSVLKGVAASKVGHSDSASLVE
jgi:hypothetical protein